MLRVSSKHLLDLWNGERRSEGWHDKLAACWGFVHEVLQRGCPERSTARCPRQVTNAKPTLPGAAQDLADCLHHGQKISAQRLIELQ